MKRASLLFAAMLPLAACSSEPEVSATNASVEEVADKVADARRGDDFVRPGKWSSKVTFEAFDMPGAPAGAQSVLESMNRRTGASEHCLTPEQARRPKEDFFAGTDKNCRYERFKMGGGKIDAVMKCSEGGMGQTMTMTGIYQPDEYRMNMAMKSEGLPGAASGMSMKMRVDAKRIGECDKKTA